MDFEKSLNEWKENVTPMKTIKFITGTLISLGATAAVIGMMKTPLIGSRGVTKLLMRLGIFVLACKAGDVAEDYFRDKFDEIQKNFSESKNEMKEMIDNVNKSNRENQ